MRYALRNQKKIEAAYSPEMLKRIIDSLNEYFKNKYFIPGKDIQQIGNDQFQTLIISDTGHTVNLIAFYVLSIKYDVVRLAFKEFIG